MNTGNIYYNKYAARIQKRNNCANERHGIYVYLRLKLTFYIPFIITTTTTICWMDFRAHPWVLGSQGACAAHHLRFCCSSPLPCLAGNSSSSETHRQQTSFLNTPTMGNCRMNRIVWVFFLATAGFEPQNFPDSMHYTLAL